MFSDTPPSLQSKMVAITGQICQSFFNHVSFFLILVLDNYFLLLLCYNTTVILSDDIKWRLLCSLPLICCSLPPTHHPCPVLFSSLPFSTFPIFHPQMHINANLYSSLFYELLSCEQIQVLLFAHIYVCVFDFTYLSAACEIMKNTYRPRGPVQQIFYRPFMEFTGLKFLYKSGFGREWFL